MTDRGNSCALAAMVLASALASPPLYAPLYAQDPWSSPGVQVIDSSGGGESKREQGDRVQARYREILSAWVSGEVDRAPDDLIELEKGVVADGDPKSRKRLLQSEQAVIHELGATSLEVLVPIAMLHHEAYSRFLAQGIRQAPLAVTHARSMARDLAILYHQQSGTEGSAVVASRVLTSLGGMMMERAQQQPAAELFFQALQLDGRNIAARLALASVYEKNAAPESAINSLRELLKLDPDHSEARFRLAMNLKRMGDSGEAKRILTEMAAANDASWVAPLVYQELARLHAQAEVYAEAEKVLRAGLGRFPDHVRMHIELASVLDRRGSFGEAKTLMQKIVSLPPGPGDAERLLYNTVRPETFAEARSILEDNSRSRLSVLAQALGTPTSGGEGGR
ncbi:MAG TPA: tetratricopeptide repeat protein [Thermoanaerobaculia bacterium]|nr:tetratricopeptide repeat protein [Thermoanaerobaculia bacterium]